MVYVFYFLTEPVHHRQTTAKDNRIFEFHDMAKYEMLY